MTDPQHVGLDLLAELAAELDPFMRGILASDDVGQAGDFVYDVMHHCMESPHSEDLWPAGSIYCIWMDIDDIVDGWPVDYGTDSETLALREFKRAAQEWLDMARTQAGLQDYVHRWRMRMAADTWPAPGGCSPAATASLCGRSLRSRQL
ncbi:hypothetical protein [Streptosporangium lutulentum]|uniref:Uncharacterized protein n=1 Tax=Streptosporangium lutulentum TaxID=1461250 RepID=A0ABT9QQF1_9ACTN|nr:hypothetical protein [Streptosporangium lutulentum]MDP9848124.1 hypothetical protein [Streptosporangium lutulentum]